MSNFFKNLVKGEYIDSYGVKYSFGGKRLIQATEVLPKYFISEGTEIIENRAFEAIGLTEVLIPTSVKTIGDSAFAYNHNLHYIRLPYSVETLGDYCFNGCTGLYSIILSESLKEFSDGVLSGCENIREILIPFNVNRIGNYALFNTGLKELPLHNGIVEIGRFAFARCKSIKNVKIPNSVSNIGEGAFQECTALEEISLPNTLTHIPNGTFAQCSSLKSISIPPSVQSIAPTAFIGCDALEKVDMGNPNIKVHQAFPFCPLLK